MFIKNLSNEEKTYIGQPIPSGEFFNIPTNLLGEYSNDEELILDIMSGIVGISKDGINLLSDKISMLNYLKNLGIQTDSEGLQVVKSRLNPFADKKVSEGNLFKRVHGVSSLDIPANTTGYIELVIPYPQCKFSGAMIINCELGDTVDFLILDTATNTYSQAPIEMYGANFPLNQFGFDVVMPNGSYENTSNYDADLYQGMELLCAYKNNSATAKKVYMNVELHEVKQ